MARQTLQNTKPRRSKPIVVKAGITRRRTAYKDGGKVDK